MNKRQDGFTLIEILVVITIIAALVGLVTLLIPEGNEKKNQVTCLNNLRQIGGLLTSSGDNQKFKYSGAAFLLQVSDQIKDDQLKVFMCPGENPPPADRPNIGTEDFTQMYRTNVKNLAKLDEGQLRAMSSYAGPNWLKYPPSATSMESRIWGCDACQNRNPHHRGICVLMDDASVKFIKIADIEGQDEGKIYVGPGSGDKRLDKMIFFPKQD